MSYEQLPRPNKKLEQQIIKELSRMFCPIHNKTAELSMPDENQPVNIKACCSFFEKDVRTFAERMRKDFLYKAEKTREREERERRKDKG